jgi:hypothetical protein
MTGLGLPRVPEGLARWPLLRVERRSQSRLQQVLRAPWSGHGTQGVCHALYLAIGSSSLILAVGSRFIATCGWWRAAKRKSRRLGVTLTAALQLLEAFDATKLPRP